jgi:hypothetical protein
MPSNERAIKGEKNKKTTDDPIPGKEKAKDRRESSLPEKSKPGESDSNRDQPKAENQGSGKNDANDKGDKKPKKKN